MAHVLPFAPAEPGPAASPAEPAPPGRLGDVLVGAGAIGAEALARALESQRTQDAPLGRILVADGLISAEALGDALARQSGLGRIDLDAAPADPDLVARFDPYLCLALEAIPWRDLGPLRVIVIGDPRRRAEAAAAFGAGAGEVTVALAAPTAIRAAITEVFRDRLRDDARELCPARFSCRDWLGASRRWWPRLAAGLVAASACAAPLVALRLLLVWVLIANAATMALRLTALFARYRLGPTVLEPPPGGIRRIRARRLPRVSLLVPLYREARVARGLLAGLQALDYPPALLDIKLVLEEHDTLTRAAIEETPLPPTMEVVSVPADATRTKPRAMNYALPLCRGEIVGVYDAEDRPDPGQIRAVVARFAEAPPEVACLQGYLDIYNTDRGWLARCFTLEYAIWFRVILLGVQRLGIPIPLGGTTVFFRRAQLEMMGGWDAHNVTEDADLGMRLARFGYRCEMLPTTTMEEATLTVPAWIRQRSRWLKGYAITWASHMRDPWALWRDLGARGFLGFQVLFLGALTSYLAIPLFWLTGALTYGFHVPVWQGLPWSLRLAFFVSMIAGQAIMLAIAFIAARDAGRLRLLPWVPTLCLYWPLGAVAAYRAVLEIFQAPFHWHKTEHGLGPAPLAESPA
ncbi:glycosyltransferase family 2 protein [Amaricoccus solimangrovi]|uniref:Glycosyltransferase n=1 Tax=Amaricoccus solimangrovi TaxID=2589815 RepID=A0A501WW80_9RHOB|nr:glycosyltransferase [Amaricoccus solimangrovi]TPE53698.1 glycosyltransferase [Amaricoccus solimangrovi]